MPRLFAENSIIKEIKTVPYENFKILGDINLDGSKIRLPNEVRKAEALLGLPVPQLPASLYMRFYRDGNRSEYERPYFSRRNAALDLLLAELTEKEGRFTDTLVDYLWAICEESTWIIPAHYHPNHGNPINCLADAFDLRDGDDVRQIDLFSAATGAALAWVWYLGGDILDAVTPVIRRRIYDMLQNRILHVYYDIVGENNWWMGDNGESLNNWTPWIVSNILTVVMLCEKNDEKRKFAVSRSIQLLDRFTSIYPSDGGCDEGPGYWTVAGASYFDCVELIRDITGGSVDLTSDPFVKKMCEYIADFNLGGECYANFADASHLLSMDWALIARMGRETGSEKLVSFAYANASEASFNNFTAGNTTYRSMRDIFEPMPENTGFTAENRIFYPDLGVMIVKDEQSGMILAAKAGHNAESHNHNDVGNFVLFKNGRPVFIDPGVERYCKDTFSSKRYTLWTMRSLYHNLPSVNGMEQLPGRQYHGRIMSCEDGAMTVDMKDAYPENSGLEAYERVVSLREGIFTCEDHMVFKTEGAVEFSLMCSGKPEITGNAINVAGAEAVFDSRLTPETDDVKLEAKLSAEWSAEKLTRIRLRSGQFNEMTFRITVK
ncbi:MAG: heparinase II/III-family protein [Clostridiales bacterium]|nr:heparinase II/III-family protein [Clostridiales bacterium]